MKKRNNTYKRMFSYENILSMYKKVKGSCRNKIEVYNFGLNLNQNLLNILYKLYNNTYEFNKYRMFIIREPKYRLIMSECIEDKIVNHLFSKYVLSDILDNNLIYSNVATRKNKGSKLAYDLFAKYTNKLIYTNKNIYCLKIDISKYFYNISHKKIVELVSKKIKDKDSLNFLKKILNTTDEDYINDEIKKLVFKEKLRVNKLNISKREKDRLIGELDGIPMYRKGYGLPIGNMSSQILAVFYLSIVDHYIKEELGCKYYIRYMDDLIIIDTDKDKLKNVFQLVSKKVEELDLKVNIKSGIYSLENGINFLGYNFKINNNKLIIRYRNDTIKRVRKRLYNLFIYDKDMYIKSKASYKGYLMFCNTNMRFKYLE